MRRLHECLIVEQIEQDGNHRRRFDASGHMLAFPPAPFVDTASIQAITTPDALQLETQLMRHCVASYTDRVSDSQYAVYKVLEPERLTLGLSLRHGGVGLDQLKGVANRAPSPEAQAAVEHWLHEQLKVARSWGKGSVLRVLGIIALTLPGVSTALDLVVTTVTDGDDRLHCRLTDGYLKRVLHRTFLSLGLTVATSLEGSYTDSSANAEPSELVPSRQLVVSHRVAPVGTELSAY